MSLSTRIAPHLPYLRRFARAITGSQSSGDAYVAATLEILITDVSLFPESASDRVSIYKLLIQHFNSVNVRPLELKSEFGWEKHAAANLTAIAPKARQAFLLISLEGFSQAETMEILDVTDKELYDLLDEASVGISKQIATDILIIEDEPLIAMDIEHMVESLGHRVVGIARTRNEALKIYSATRPSMILADIQLADGSSGIDAVNNILSQDASSRHLHHRFPRTAADRRATGTYIPCDKTFQSGHGQGSHHPGTVLQGKQQGQGVGNPTTARRCCVGTKSRFHPFRI